MNNAPLNPTDPRSAGTGPTAINWPTVMVSTGAAAIIAAIILSIGVVGLSRVHNNDGQTIVVQAQESASESASGSNSAPRTSGTSTSTSASAAASEAAGALGNLGDLGDLGDLSPSGEPQAENTSTSTESTSNNGGDTDNSGQSGDSRRWVPASALPADFAVTTQSPTLADFNNIVYFLTATDASDAAKARNIESEDAIIVPRTVSRIGLFRAPRGGSRVTGPMERNGDRVTVQLNAYSAGIPDVSMPIIFIYLNGTWRLANSSLCNGVRTVGLPIYCNA